jgi:hypothetical protein
MMKLLTSVQLNQGTIITFKIRVPSFVFWLHIKRSNSFNSFNSNIGILTYVPLAAKRRAQIVLIREGCAK